MLAVRKIDQRGQSFDLALDAELTLTHGLERCLCVTLMDFDFAKPGAQALALDLKEIWGKTHAGLFGLGRHGLHS